MRMASAPEDKRQHSGKKNGFNKTTKSKKGN